MIWIVGAKVGLTEQAGEEGELELTASVPCWDWAGESQIYNDHWK